VSVEMPAVNVSAFLVSPLPGVYRARSTGRTLGKVFRPSGHCVPAEAVSLKCCLYIRGDALKRRPHHLLVPHLDRQVVAAYSIRGIDGICLRQLTAVRSSILGVYKRQCPMVVRIELPVPDIQFAPSRGKPHVRLGSNWWPCREGVHQFNEPRAPTIVGPNHRSEVRESRANAVNPILRLA